MNPKPVPFIDAIPSVYRQLETRYEAKTGILWFFMKPEPRPCFNTVLLTELRRLQRTVEHLGRSESERGNDVQVRYLVCCSRLPRIFNLGGDLDLFIRMVKERDADGLRNYARLCIEIVHSSAVNYGMPVTTIALVQGDAMGGGFEAALSCGVIVAEKQAQFGFPEILFNLFPGMGAYSLLARRIGPARAEKMMTNPRIYTASDLHESGIVDVLAEDGEGEMAAVDFIKRHSRRRNAYMSMLRLRERINPVSFDELKEVADIWVETALKLESKDIRLMERLVKAQDKMVNGGAAVPPGSEGRRDYA